MRPSLCASCIASLLKLLIFFQAFVGVSIVIYSIWILDHWNRRGYGVGIDLGDVPQPWFGYLMLGVGVVVCLIAFVGHVAAEAVNGCCLCFYVVLATMLMLLEGALVGFMVLDKQWEEDLPKDPTGELEKLRTFIEDNVDIFKWIGLSVVVVQVLSLFFATILRALALPCRRDYDSDDDFIVARQPLLNPQYAPHPVLVPIDGKGIYSDIRSSRMRQKMVWQLDNLEYFIIVCLSINRSVLVHYGLNPVDYANGATDAKGSPSI